ELVRPTALMPLNLSRLQGWLDRSHHSLRDPILKLKHIAQTAVVAFSPKMDSGGRIDELPADPQPRATSADAALQHVAHSQFACNTADIDRHALIDEGRVAGDDEEPADA